MAAINPVGPDSPVTVKVALDGEFRRFKIPLKELGPNTFSNKLRTLLHIQAHQNLLLERYSDSAGSFVVLDPYNTAVWKQLYRAAKAKLKLRIRATVDAVPPAPLPASVLPATVFKEEPKVIPPPPLPAPPPPMPPSSSASDYQRLLAEIEYRGHLKALTLQNEQLAKKIQQETIQPDLLHPKIPSFGAAKLPVRSFAPAIVNANTSGPANQEGLVCGLPNTIRGCPAYGTGAFAGLTQFSVCCNVCSSDIPRVHWHCSICQDGDYDLCANCVDLGHHCEVDSHFLIKRIIENGKVINATRETISKKFGSSVDRERAREVIVTHQKSAAPTTLLCEAPVARRTCNHCIDVNEEHQFVTCTVCEDYDLCKTCLVSAPLTHNPMHAFKPATEQTHLTTKAKALCPAGRGLPHHAICDQCDQKIVGVRHKCFECPDYDLCNNCVSKASKKHPGHRFAPLYTPIAMPAMRAHEHPGVSCDGPLCTDKNSWISGVRYKCTVCHDTDFCASCEALPTNTHNRSHPLIQFRTPVAHVWVTTHDELSNDPTPLGDRLPQTSSKATETTAPVNAATQVQTIAEFKPIETAKEAAKIESQRGSPFTPFDGVFISDTIADGSKMPASQVFCQTWTLRNPGPVVWPAGCCLRFVGGDRMLNMDADNPASTDDLDRAISSNVLRKEVSIGATVQFSVLLKAPTRPGKAISYWRIKTPEGFAFGHKLWCEIDVIPAVPSEPPSPRAAMAPEAAATTEVTRLTGLVAEKSGEITRLTQAMTDLQQALAGAKAEKAAALGDVHRNMQTQRAELLAKLEEVKAESDRIRASQMIFPKLEKESPESSVYETARQDPAEAEATDKPAGLTLEQAAMLAGAAATNAHLKAQTEAQTATSELDDDFVEDLEGLDIDEQSTDDGFLTDEEYEILDSEFDDVLSEAK